jgi:hypothetical protein
MAPLLRVLKDGMHPLFDDIEDPADVQGQAEVLW